jgi:thioredoxin 1
MTNAPAVTDATFTHEVEHHAGVAVVDFGADWCPPCRVIAPVVGALAAEYAGRAKVLTLDTDANPETANRYGVRGLPTVLFFKDGKVVDTIVGAVPRSTIEQRLAKHL